MELNCPVCKVGKLTPMSLGGNSEGYFAITACTTVNKKIVAQVPMPVDAKICDKCGHISLFTKTKEHLD